MAKMLTEYWGDVLTNKPVDNSLLASWLRDLTQKMPPPSDPWWTLTVDNVLEALHRCHETAPGPDGIPYGAFKKLGKYAASFLFDAAEDLQDPDMQAAVPPDFNYAFLCCLPKVASRTDATHGDVHAPSRTRPLSVVDTDNRLIANAYRLLLEPVVNKFVSEMQRGFLPDRSMLANVIDVDLQAMRISLQHPRGAVVLFDFASAFPSLSQEYMWQVLEHVGIPACIVDAIQKLYENNKHFIKVKSGVFPSFTATSGVRQGCPLSPLLFALVADVLLRRLHDKLPHCLTRAFADDTAMVMPNFAANADMVMAIFKDFARISNLRLNIDKTVMIPLWESTAEGVHRWLRSDFPQWAKIDVAWSACYLGVHVGPHRARKNWTKAIAKFQKTVEAWSSLSPGMSLNASIFRTFCSSVLSFLWQLDDVPEEVYKLEHWALRRLAPGPGNWLRPAELHHMKSFGAPFDFPSFRHMALAAKLRFMRFEPQLNWDGNYAQMLAIVRSLDGARSTWSSWYLASPILALARATDIAASLNVTAEVVCGTLRERLARQGLVNKLIKKRFQAEAVCLLAASDHYNAECALRHRLKRLRRWTTLVPDGVLARRALRYVKAAFEQVPRRVALVLLRSLFNGWCTARRFQVTGSSCLFHCSMRHSDLQEDSIEHYAHCPVVVDFARRTLHMSNDASGTTTSFLCLDRDTPEDVRILQLLLLYAVYSATNTLRHSCEPPSAQHVPSMLMQFVKQGAQGSCSARGALSAALNVQRAVRPRHQ